MPPCDNGKLLVAERIIIVKYLDARTGVDCIMSLVNKLFHAWELVLLCDVQSPFSLLRVLVYYLRDICQTVIRAFVLNPAKAKG